MLDAGNVELANQLRLVNVHDAEICPLVGVAALCVDKLFRRAVLAQADLATAFEAVVNDVVRLNPIFSTTVTLTAKRTRV